MGTIFVLTGLSIVAFSSIFGFASVLPPQFLVSVLAGTGFGSVIVALLNIVTLLISYDYKASISHDIEASAMYFFGSAIFIVIAAIVVIFFTFRTGVMQFYVRTLS